MNNTNTTGIKSVAVAFGMFAMLIFGFIMFWYWAGYVELSVKELMQATGGGAEIQKQKIQFMRKELRDTAKERALLRKLAITEDQVPDFLNELELLGGGDIQIFTKGVNIQKSAGVVSITLSFSSEFDGIVSVVKSVLDVKYAVYVDLLELRTGKYAEGDTVQDVTMHIMVPLLNKDNK